MTCTGRRSISSAAPGSDPTSPAPTCSTASGCVARAGASTPATQLRTAHDLLTAIGMEAFAERARRELLATGEKVRRRRDDDRHQLTPQEEQIARLARDGLSNPEIGAQLFISARTVEWHLRKVFTKLDITLPPAAPIGAPRRRPRPDRRLAVARRTTGAAPGVRDQGSPRAPRASPTVHAAW